LISRVIINSLTNSFNTWNVIVFGASDVKHTQIQLRKIIFYMATFLLSRNVLMHWLIVFFLIIIGCSSSADFMVKTELINYCDYKGIVYPCLLDTVKLNLLLAGTSQQFQVAPDIISCESSRPVGWVGKCKTERGGLDLNNLSAWYDIKKDGEPIGGIECIYRYQMKWEKDVCGPWAQ
jgi:hypothetical protein